MRSVRLTCMVAAVVALSVAAQEPGDPVTYTNGGVIYTAILDPDLDTVSDAPVSTIAPNGAGAAAGGGVLATTTDVDGNTVTVSNGVTLPTAAVVQATTAPGGGGAAAAGGVSNEQDVVDNDSTDDDTVFAFDISPAMNELRIQHVQRRSSPTPRPDQPQEQKLHKRQAALGGGGGNVQTTQTGLQTISGYSPPGNTEVPDPVYSSGSILVPSQIPGYTGNENSAGVSGGGVSSGSIRLNVGQTILGAAAGAALFAML